MRRMITEELINELIDSKTDTHYIYRCTLNAGAYTKDNYAYISTTIISQKPLPNTGTLTYNEFVNTLAGFNKAQVGIRGWIKNGDDVYDLIDCTWLAGDINQLIVHNVITYENSLVWTKNLASIDWTNAKCTIDQLVGAETV